MERTVLHMASVACRYRVGQPPPRMLRVGARCHLHRQAPSHGPHTPTASEWTGRGANRIDGRSGRRDTTPGRRPQRRSKRSGGRVWLMRRNRAPRQRANATVTTVVMRRTCVQPHTDTWPSSHLLCPHEHASGCEPHPHQQHTQRQHEQQTDGRASAGARAWCHGVQEARQRVQLRRLVAFRWWRWCASARRLLPGRWWIAASLDELGRAARADGSGPLLGRSTHRCQFTDSALSRTSGGALTLVAPLSSVSSRPHSGESTGEPLGDGVLGICTVRARCPPPPSQTTLPKWVPMHPGCMPFVLHGCACNGS